MYKDKKILAIIPARGGSKGLPKKNIKNINGIPLIGWTILNAKNCCEIDRIIVSTNCKDIAEVSIKYGAEVPFLRPNTLAQDSSPSIDAITHIINKLNKKGESYDIVLLLEPTSPLRKKNDLSKAIKQFVNNYEKANSLISVGEIHLENPFISKVINNGLLQNLMPKDFEIKQRQDYPEVYFPYGVIYASKVQFVLNENKVYDENALPFAIERWQNYEIDDIYDFIAIEQILKIKKEEIL